MAKRAARVIWCRKADEATDAVGACVRLISSTQRTFTMNLPIESKLSSAIAHVVDSGKIVTGAGVRLPSVPAHVADAGKIRLGAGVRLPAQRKPS